MKGHHQLLLVVILTFAAASGAAQVVPITYHTYTISPFEFVPLDSALPYQVAGDVPAPWHITWQDGNAGPETLVAPVHLPDGAVIKYMQLEYCRKTPAGTAEAEGWLAQVCDDDPRAGCSTSDLEPKVRPDIEGCHASIIETAARVVDNEHHTFLFVLQLENGFGNVAFGPVKLYYRTEAPPSPNVATFSDVPTSHPLFRFVEALFNTGAIAGCGDGRFCPASPVTRGQLAVILAQALGLGW